MNIGKWVKYVLDLDSELDSSPTEMRHSLSLESSGFTDHFLDTGPLRAQGELLNSLSEKGFNLNQVTLDEFTSHEKNSVIVEMIGTVPKSSRLQVQRLHDAVYDSMFELGFYRSQNKSFLGENQYGRMRQYGIYKFACLVEYETSTEPRRGLDDIVSDVRAIPTVTIVSVVLANEKVSTGRYVAGLQIKFIPSYPGNLSQPEEAKSYILRSIKKIKNVKGISRVSLKLDRVE